MVRLWNCDKEGRPPPRLRPRKRQRSEVAENRSEGGAVTGQKRKRRDSSKHAARPENAIVSAGGSNTDDDASMEWSETDDEDDTGSDTLVGIDEESGRSDLDTALAELGFVGEDIEMEAFDHEAAGEPVSRDDALVVLASLAASIR